MTIVANCHKCQKLAPIYFEIPNYDNPQAYCSHECLTDR
jgi:hypothetical protein